MEYKGAKIQILDIPGLIAGAAMGKGRGKEVIGVVRSADMIVVLVDVFNQGHVDVLMKELYDAGIRVKPAKTRYHDKENLPWGRPRTQGRHT